MNILLTKGNEKFEFLEEIVGSALNRFLDPHRERNDMFDTNAFYITTDNGNRIKFEEFLVRLDYVMSCTRAKVYEACGEIEGRGGKRSLGYYSTFDLANEAATGSGIWGRDGSVFEVTGYFIGINGVTKFIRDEDLHDILSETKESILKRAKAKLANFTPDELEVLGLK